MVGLVRRGSDSLGSGKMPPPVVLAGSVVKTSVAVNVGPAGADNVAVESMDPETVNVYVLPVWV